jgi:two-component system chemotaxis response regulator CheB
MALARDLPADLPAAVMVVVHISANGTSVLPEILNRSGPLLAAHPRGGEAIECGRIYVAPPDHHLLVERGYLRLPRGPRENGHRPAVDALFRTAARAYGRRVVGVILSGTLDDGTAGLQAIKMRGGVAVVQDPAEALFSGMPRSAIENVEVDHVVPLSDIAPLLVRLAREEVEGVDAEPVPRAMDQEANIVELDMDAVEGKDRPGTPSSFACPECGGVLWELHDGKLLRFRCRVGHAFSSDSLLSKQSDELEAALWTALRALEERVSLATRVAKHARERNQTAVARRFEERMQESRQHAEAIRRLLLNGDETPRQADA